MEELFEFLIIAAIALLGLSSKINKSKKSKTAGKPAQTPTPAPKQNPQPRQVPDLPGDPNRQNIENAVAAFAALLNTDADLPDPDKPAAEPLRQPTAIEAERTQAVPAKVKLAKTKRVLSGESSVDEHGCIGGSMPDHSAEGESIAEHAEHEMRRQQHLLENAPAFDASALRRPSQEELRKAVVMAEVLGKPVSLKGRRI